jgi:uncharacterized RmlC-like cupin family protein
MVPVCGFWLSAGPITATPTSLPIAKAARSPTSRPRRNPIYELNESVPMSRYQPVRIVPPALFDGGTVQTPGSQRRSAITTDKGIATTLWGGIFIVEPGAETGIHHHGKQETIAYVLEGECSVRWGESGEYCADARAGDFIHVPAWLPHMEINRSAEHRFVWVVVRSTAEPIVINLPDNYWERQLDASAFTNAGELVAKT